MPKTSVADLPQRILFRIKSVLKKAIAKAPPLERLVNKTLSRRQTAGATFSRITGADQPFFAVTFSKAIEDSRRYYEILQEAPLNVESAEDFVRRNSQPSEYLDFHHIRFAEQLSMYSWLCQKFPDAHRVLDISTMPYTTNMLKLYRPSTELVTIDLPEAQGGPSIARFENLGVEAHFEVDLNREDLDQLALRVTKFGKFDLIYASEVIEHVRFDFGKFLKFCLDCLAPRGLVIVTTPNFHAEWKIDQIRQGLNPQHRFSGNNANDGSYHFREYSMRELREHAERLGAAVVSEVYSWSLLEDRKYRVEDQFCHLRENMVFICSNAKISI